MARAASRPEHLAHGSEACRSIVVLPARVHHLVNQGVLAERMALIEARLADDAHTRVRRKRCAEIIANHLLEN